MLRTTARSKATWWAMLAALVVGLALLLMLTSQSIHHQPAQADTQQTAPKAVLTQGGVTLAELSRFDGVVSTIELPQADGTAAQPKPISIGLARTATGNLDLSSWHQAARAGADNHKLNVRLVIFNSSGVPTVSFLLTNAWPAEYRITTQQGTRLVEEVTLTADDFQRVAN
jgi:hypothetical protein